MSLLIVPKTERMAKISGYTDQRLTDSLVYTQNSMENPQISTELENLS